MTESKRVKLIELVKDFGGLIQTGPFGSQLHQSDYVESGVPVIMPSDMVGGKIDLTDISKVTADKANTLSKHFVGEGDIVLARRGDIGRCAFVSSTESGFLCGTGSIKISVPEEILLPRYFFYYLQTKEIIGWLNGIAVGSTLKNLSAGAVGQMPIDLPSIKIQNISANILNFFDDLIENNQRRIEILEESAKALYREWFVHYRYPGHENDTMVDSELGPIPSGWALRKIGDLGTIVTGNTPPTKQPELYGEKFPFLTPSDIKKSLFCETERYLSPKGASKFENKILPSMSIVFTCIGSIGAICMTKEPTVTNQQINSIIPHDRKTTCFILQLCLQERKRINNYATGSAVPIINKNTFSNIPIVHPPNDLIHNFENLTDQMIQEILILANLNLSLQASRDLLLPRLISGELDVTDLDLVA